MGRKLTEAEADRAVEELAGTADNLREFQLAEELDCELEDIEEAMVDANYERCAECEWWCEVCDLDEKTGVCSGCRAGSEDDDDD